MEQETKKQLWKGKYSAANCQEKRFVKETENGSENALSLGSNFANECKQDFGLLENIIICKSKGEVVQCFCTTNLLVKDHLE